MIGLDSEYDYDPVWAKCLELNIAPSFHSGARRSGLWLSPSNFVYNHIGHFAAANHAACKAMFLGGVTRRFPGLNMAFLEGGAGWACLLYGDPAPRMPARLPGRNSQGVGERNPPRQCGPVEAEPGRQDGLEGVSCRSARRWSCMTRLASTPRAWL